MEISYWWGSLYEQNGNDPDVGLEFTFVIISENCSHDYGDDGKCFR